MPARIVQNLKMVFLRSKIQEEGRVSRKTARFFSLILVKNLNFVIMYIC